MKKLFLAAIICLSLNSCSRDYLNYTLIWGKSSPDISGNYTLVSMKYRENPAAGEVDKLAAMDICQKESILVLKSDGSFNHSNNNIKCSSTTNDRGTWAVSNQSIIFNGDANHIGSLQNKSLTIIRKNVNSNDDQLTSVYMKR